MTNSSCFVHDASEFLERNQARDSVEANDIRDSLITESQVLENPAFFLLYLNQYTFGGNEEEKAELTMVIQACIDNSNINLILVNEQDVLKGGCKFDEFFKVTPQKLINEPHSLYKEMAIPLHSMKEYRDVSLNLIINKIAASDSNLSLSNEGKGCWRI